MKSKSALIMTILIFFAVVFTVYFSVNTYLFLKGLYSIPKDPAGKIFYTVIFFFFALSYIIGRILDKISPSSASDFFIHIGAVWLALMLYLFLGSVLLDIARLLLTALKLKPLFIYNDYDKAKKISSLIILFISIVLTVYGYYNAINPVVKNIEIFIPKSSSKYEKLKIAFISDVHLGVILGEKFAARLTNLINEQKPDIVLFGGDLLDEDAVQVLRKNSGVPLLNLRAPLGVYGILGNHEYIGGIKKAEEFYSLHNIKLLVDEAILIDNSFYLIGRDDRTSERFAKRKRKSLSELTGPLDSSLPMILLDHQPFNLEISAQNKIDLHLSGHTHHGQLWPFNHITKFVYEVSWGYKKKNNTHIYVSSGFGTWGPPVRIGSKSEIVFINVLFLKSE